MTAGANTEAEIIPSVYRAAGAYVPLTTYYGSNTITIDAYTTDGGILRIRPSEREQRGVIGVVGYCIARDGGRRAGDE